MKHPQTLAKELATMFPNDDLFTIGQNACCALTLMWCLKMNPDDITAIKMVQLMRKKGVIKTSCVVKWYDAVEYLSGKKLKEVKFVKIKSIKDIKERTPVLFSEAGDAEGVGHWVGVEKGKIGFNSLEFSNKVKNGKPVEMRVLVFE